MAKKNVDESPMSKQFNDLKAKHPDAMLLFRCGDFYECYCEDAREAEKILGITLTYRNGDKLPMAGFPHHALDTYLPKLIRAGKRVAICDQLPEPPKGKRVITELVTPGESNNNNSNNQTSTTMEPKNNNQNESANVQNNAQVSNNTNESVEVAELSMDDIKPRVVKAAVQAANGGAATTIPMGKHGSIVICGCGGTKKTAGPAVQTDLQSGCGECKDLKSDERIANANTHGGAIANHAERKVQPAAKSVGSGLPAVTLVVYTTKHGDQAPRIEGFGGETDPRWKRHYDEKLRLKAEKEKADKKNEKLRQAMKGKSKEHRELLMKKWVSVGSDPFNAGYFTDRTTGEKTYTMVMGAKYMDAARELVSAYNSGDAQAIALAEQAVVDVKSGIVAEKKAEREERKAKGLPTTPPEGKGSEPSFTLDQVAAMLGRLLPEGAASTEDIKKLLQAA